MLPSLITELLSPEEVQDLQHHMSQNTKRRVQYSDLISLANLTVKDVQFAFAMYEECMFCTGSRDSRGDLSPEEWNQMTTKYNHSTDPFITFLAVHTECTKISHCHAALLMLQRLKTCKTKTTRDQREHILILLETFLKSRLALQEQHGNLCLLMLKGKGKIPTLLQLPPDPTWQQRSLVLVKSIMEASSNVLALPSMTETDFNNICQNEWLIKFYHDKLIQGTVDYMQGVQKAIAAPNLENRMTMNLLYNIISISSLNMDQITQILDNKKSVNKRKLRKRVLGILKDPRLIKYVYDKLKTLDCDHCDTDLQLLNKLDAFWRFRHSILETQ